MTFSVEKAKALALIMYLKYNHVHLKTLPENMHLFKLQISFKIK